MLKRLDNYLQEKFNENPVPFILISILLCGLLDGMGA